MLTDDELATIEARATAATAGPLTMHGSGWESLRYLHDANGHEIAIGPRERERDLALFAMAREDVLALVRRLTDLRGERDALSRAILDAAIAAGVCDPATESASPTRAVVLCGDLAAAVKHNRDVAAAARAYAAAWKTYDDATEEAAAAFSGREVYDAETRDRLSRLARARREAHVAALRACVVLP